MILWKKGGTFVRRAINSTWQDGRFTGLIEGNMPVLPNTCQEKLDATDSLDLLFVSLAFAD